MDRRWYIFQLFSLTRANLSFKTLFLLKMFSLVSLYTYSWNLLLLVVKEGKIILTILQRLVIVSEVALTFSGYSQVDVSLD